MRYIQHRGGNKLHIAFEIEGGLTQPVCGRVFDKYRMSINVPLGNACKNCCKRINSKSFNQNEFIKKYL